MGFGWIVVLVAASVVVGWLTARLVAPPALVIAAPAAVLLMLGVVLGAKLLRYPDAPLVGDGFSILVGCYAIAGLVGGALGRLRLFRPR